MVSISFGKGLPGKAICIAMHWCWQDVGSSGCCRVQVEMSAAFIGSYASQAPFVRAWWSKSHCRAAALGGGYGEVVFLIVLAVKQSRYDVRIRC